MQLADSELQLDELSDELTLCPAIYWAEHGAQFVVCKVAAERFRCQFFYSETEQYGTGHDQYDSLGDCVVTLLQVQSDHERQMANISSGATLAKDDDYHGPVVILTRGDLIRGDPSRVSQRPRRVASPPAWKC